MKLDPSVGPGELKVLNYVAEKGPLTVREVADTLGVELGVGLTTIQQMMDRLRHKGLLAREKASGPFKYRAVRAKEDVIRSVIGKFVQESLGGSVSPFVRYLAEAEDLSEDDIRELNELLGQLSDRKRGGK
jgi:predicted transcriptional regulator